MQGLNENEDYIPEPWRHESFTQLAGYLGHVYMIKSDESMSATGKAHDLADVTCAAISVAALVAAACHDEGMQSKDGELNVDMWTAGFHDTLKRVSELSPSQRREVFGTAYDAFYLHI